MGKGGGISGHVGRCIKQQLCNKRERNGRLGITDGRETFEGRKDLLRI